MCINIWCRNLFLHVLLGYWICSTSSGNWLITASELVFGSGALHRKSVHLEKRIEGRNSRRTALNAISQCVSHAGWQWPPLTPWLPDPNCRKLITGAPSRSRCVWIMHNLILPSGWRRTHNAVVFVMPRSEQHARVNICRRFLSTERLNYELRDTS